jgi:hypothetical protein
MNYNLQLVMIDLSNEYYCDLFFVFLYGYYSTNYIVHRTPIIAFESAARCFHQTRLPPRTKDIMDGGKSRAFK